MTEMSHEERLSSIPTEQFPLGLALNYFAPIPYKRRANQHDPGNKRLPASSE